MLLSGVPELWVLLFGACFFGGGGGAELDILGAGFGFIGLLLRDKAGRTCVFGLRFGFCESILVDTTVRASSKVGIRYCN